MRTVAQKMGIKAGCRAIFIGAPEEVFQDMALPGIHVKKRLAGKFDYIHLFARTIAGQEELFPKLKTYLESTGALWVSWPKNKQLGTDLSIRTVIRTGYSHGLVESTTLSINEVWSAIKFTHPKKGKAYKNSYGTLPPGVKE